MGTARHTGRQGTRPQSPVYPWVPPDALWADPGPAGRWHPWMPLRPDEDTPPARTGLAGFDRSGKWSRSMRRGSWMASSDVPARPGSLDHDAG